MKTILLGIVIFAGQVHAAHLEKTHAVIPETGRRIENRFIVQWNDGHTSVESSANEKTFRKEFAAKHLGKIKHFEHDQYVRFSKQPVAKISTAGLENWGQDVVEASKVWGQGIKGAGVIIGVVDSVIDYAHPQLQSRIALNAIELRGQPGVDDDQNGYVDDVYGWDFVKRQNLMSEHGTHLAGTLVADHAIGTVKGMAPEAQIVPAAFIDNDGGSVGDAVLAIQYAIQRGSRIVNMGWGGAPSYIQSLYDVLANHPDVLFVTAAGNDGVDLDQNPDYPASFNLPNLITVGAINASNNYISWSNRGLISVHLAAPGMDILSTGTLNRDITMSGTSVGVPFVAGAAALLWSYKPTATVAQIKQAIMEGVETGPFPVLSQGRLNVSKSLARLKAVTDN